MEVGVDGLVRVGRIPAPIVEAPDAKYGITEATSSSSAPPHLLFVPHPMHDYHRPDS
jgi:hypothetical protein